jgi:hypothetical protein
MFFKMKGKIMKKKINIKEEILNNILYDMKKYIDFIKFIETDSKQIPPFKTNVSIKNLYNENEVPCNVQVFIGDLLDILGFENIKVHFVGLYYDENEIHIIEKGKELKEFTIKLDNKNFKKIYTELIKYFESF